MNILDNGANMALDKIGFGQPEQLAQRNSPMPATDGLQAPEGQSTPEVQPVGTMPAYPFPIGITFNDGTEGKAIVGEGNRVLYQGQVVGTFDPATYQIDTSQRPGAQQQETPSKTAVNPWNVYSNMGALTGQALGTLEVAPYTDEWYAQAAEKAKTLGSTPQEQLSQDWQSMAQEYETRLPGGESHERYQTETPTWRKVLAEAVPILTEVGMGVVAGSAIGATKWGSRLPKAVRAMTGIEKPRPNAEAMKKFLPTARTLLGKGKKYPQAAAQQIAVTQSKKEQNLIQKFVDHFRPMGDIQKAVGQTRKLGFAKRLESAAKLRDDWLKLHPGDDWGADIAARRALEGEYEWGKYAIKGFEESDLRKLYSIGRTRLDDIWRQGGKLRRGVTPDVRAMDLQTGMRRVFYDKKPPTNSQLKAFEEAFGPEFANTMAALTKDPHWGLFADIMNLPRALLASGDMSAPFRQGIVFAFRNPIKYFGRPLRSMMKTALGGDDALKMMDDIQRHREFFGESQYFGLKQFDIPGTVASKYRPGRPETFVSRLAEKIPFVKWAERNYIVFLNEQRQQVWHNLYPTWQKMGAGVDDFYGLAKFVNDGTGWGGLGRLTEYSPLLSSIFFSPRLVMSRLRMPSYLFSRSSYVRKEAWKTFFSFMGGVSGVLGTANMLFPDQVSIELPKRGKTPSADVGKLKWGNTRYDLWGGFVQYYRLMNQLIKAEKGITGSSKTRDRKRSDLLYEFVQTKLSPFAGFIFDMLEGQTYEGDEMFDVSKEGITEQAKERLMVLWVQDMLDAMEEDGLLTGAMTGAAAFFGIGATSYKARGAGGSTPQIDIKPDIDIKPNINIKPNIKLRR